VAQKLISLEDAGEQSGLAQYLYEVALLQQGMLRGEALTGFVEKTLGRL